MNANHVLLWMSAREQGSWTQFKSAVEELRLAEQDQDSIQDNFNEHDTPQGFPYHQRLRLNLQSLAHAEFFSNGSESGWRVVPPSLAVHRQSDSWIGILCGARSPSLLGRLDQPLPASVETHIVSWHPDIFLFYANRKEGLLETARILNLYTQLNAPVAILLSLPKITQQLFRRKIKLPFGREWKIYRFSVSSLQWKASTYEKALSSKGDLFHFSIGYRHQHLYCSRGDSYEVAPRIGKFLSLARRGIQIIRYDGNTQSLFMPGSLRPPILIERALNLCSGLPAQFDASTGLLAFRSIPKHIAQLSANLLHQEIHE